MNKKLKRVLRGYSFLHPDGSLDYRVVENIDAAQSNAAFASERRHSHIEMPNDWKRAYKQGFRVVRVALKVKPWQKPANAR